MSRGNLQRECDMLPDAERRLVAAVFGQTGLAVDHYRARPLHRRIRAALRSARASSIAECLSAVETDQVLALKILNALLIGYTTPFRDEPVFRQLRDNVMPELVAMRPGLRVWSAGCSNGAELYSVALLLAELGCLEKSTLRGTDSRAAAIAEARQYAGTFWTSIPAPFFDLKKAITKTCFLDQARQIDWRVDNVFSFTADASFDVVFCRNLAIYLQPSAALRLWELIARALAPEGILVAGKAEKPLPSTQWHRIDTCIYQVVNS